jgi:hypothetical protein
MSENLRQFRHVLAEWPPRSLLQALDLPGLSISGFSPPTKFLGNLTDLNA